MLGTVRYGWSLQPVRPCRFLGTLATPSQATTACSLESKRTSTHIKGKATPARHVLQQAKPLAGVYTGLMDLLRYAVELSLQVIHEPDNPEPIKQHSSSIAVLVLRIVVSIENMSKNSEARRAKRPLFFSCQKHALESNKSSDCRQTKRRYTWQARIILTLVCFTCSLFLPSGYRRCLSLEYYK